MGRPPIGVHFNMFVPALEGMTDKEQKQRWLPLARELKIMGTYAQTELGHGTIARVGGGADDSFSILLSIIFALHVLNLFPVIDFLI